MVESNIFNKHLTTHTKDNHKQLNIITLFNEGIELNDIKYKSRSIDFVFKLNLTTQIKEKKLYRDI
jgi:hypothetical protein